MTLPRLRYFEECWEDWPPLRKYFAASQGHKPKRRSNDLAELLAMFPGGVIKGLPNG
jgi:hypothetical protein